MKKIILASCLSLALAGCLTAQDAATSITTATQSVQQKVKSVQGYATQLCSYVPTASTVIGIFNSGIGTDVSLVANAICNAVTTLPLADGPGKRQAAVAGVIIKGHFVK